MLCSGVRPYKYKLWIHEKEVKKLTNFACKMFNLGNQIHFLKGLPHVKSMAFFILRMVANFFATLCQKATGTVVPYDS